MTVSVIICAAGRGERAGFGRNKLLLPLNGQPVIYTVTEKFYGIADQIIIACADCDREEIAAICAPFGVTLTRGGASRTESVFNSLKAVTGDVVLIHDGARPFIDGEDIRGCIACAKKYGSAICATPCTDTLCVSDGEEICSVPDRRQYYSLQTPQCFLTEEIRTAYSLAVKDGNVYTDDSSIYLKYVKPPRLYVGKTGNIKLTYMSDFSAPPPFKAEGVRIGYGQDVHAFKDGDGVTLCGVKIPCPYSLIAHSDGDVPVHAVMDALLSAAGLKDIGCYFPDTDERYENADSVALLKRVVNMLKERGYAPVNLSVTIQAETPRLAPYIGEMKERLAAVAGLTPEDIGITAGTSEGLGFVGKRLGIAASAAVLIAKI